MATHKAEPHPIRGPLPPPRRFLSLFLHWLLPLSSLSSRHTSRLRRLSPLLPRPPLLCHRRAETLRLKKMHAGLHPERGTAASLHVFATRRQAEHLDGQRRVSVGAVHPLSCVSLIYRKGDLKNRCFTYTNPFMSKRSCWKIRKDFNSGKYSLFYSKHL